MPVILIENSSLVYIKLLEIFLLKKNLFKRFTHMVFVIIYIANVIEKFQFLFFLDMKFSKKKIKRNL